MKKLSNAFKIQFIGLKLGMHEFEFDLNKAFFESIENSLIADGEVKASVHLDKKETMMILEIELVGNVFTSCDRCNDPIELELDEEYRLVYKFGTEQSEDENLIVLDPDAYEIEVSAPLYELMVVSLPTRIMHDKEDCNKEVMALYSTLIVNANEADADELDWDDEDWDDEGDEDWDGDEPDDDDGDDDDDPDDSDDDRPIDPRWAALKNLN